MALGRRQISRLFTSIMKGFNQGLPRNNSSFNRTKDSGLGIVTQETRRDQTNSVSFVSTMEKNTFINFNLNRKL